MIRHEITRGLVAAGYTFGVTAAIGKWAIHYARMERGYDAFGGEYLLILMVCWAAWKVVNYFLDSLEETKHEGKRKERRGGGTARE